MVQGYASGGAITGVGGRMWLHFSLLHLCLRVSGRNESLTDHGVCFSVLQPRPNADHVCRPRCAAVRDTEQFPGIPGNEISQDLAFLPPVPVYHCQPQGLRDLPRNSMGGNKTLEAGGRKCSVSLNHATWEQPAETEALTAIRETDAKEILT